MKKVLIDSSVWIDYFKGSKSASVLDDMLENNLVAVNNLILCELVPLLKVQHHKEIIEMLSALTNLDLSPDWHEVMNIQYLNLKHGIHKVGIVDILIAQNAKQNSVQLFSFDKHFDLIKKHIGCEIFTHP